MFSCSWCCWMVVDRCGDPRTSIANSRFPAPGVVGWRRGVSCLRLPLSVLVKLVLDVILCLNSCQPVFEVGALHLLLMIAHGLVMVAIGREGHTSSLMATRDFFIWLLLIVVEVAILPLRT